MPGEVHPASTSFRVTSRLLYLPTCKNGRPRTIQLNSKAVAELRNLQGHRNDEARTKDSNYIFPPRKGTKKGYVFDLRKPFEKALKTAGIEGVRLHDVRRTFGSWGVQGGIDLFRTAAPRTPQRRHHANDLRILSRREPPADVGEHRGDD